MSLIAMPFRRILLAVAACLAALTTFSSPALAVEPGVVIGMRPAGHGGNVEEVSKSRELGAGWVRLFMDWSRVEHAPGQYDAPSLREFDARIKAYRSGPQPVNVLMVVVRAPQWAAAHPEANQAKTVQPPADPETYARFVGEMAKRYAGQVQAWEIWNEEDEGKWWYPSPDPDAYAALLKATAPRIRAADPRATIVLGGLTAANFDYVERMYDAGAASAFDAIGIHMDTACRVDSPDQYYREPDGRIGRYAYTGYREVRRVTEERGDPKPIWFTEIGWSTLTETCQEGANTGKRPSGVDEASQARFLTEAFACMAADSYVGPALWFSLQDVDQSTARYDHRLGLYRDNGTPKPAVAAFKQVAAGAVGADEDCGGKLDAKPPAVQISAPTQYLERLRIKVRAQDAETKVTKIELYANGTRIPGSARAATYDLDWLRARELPPGEHTITARAYDEGLNIGEASVKVVKVTPEATRVPTAMNGKDLRVRMLRDGRVQISGRLRYDAPAGFPRPSLAVPIRIFLDVERRGSWRTISKFSKLARRSFRITNELKSAGRKWRVRVLYQGAAPYRPLRRVVAFKR